MRGRSTRASPAASRVRRRRHRTGSTNRSARYRIRSTSRGQTGVALLDDALAHVECRVAQRHPGGDHTICVGQVESATVRPDRPLLYYRGGYAQLER